MTGMTGGAAPPRAGRDLPSAVAVALSLIAVLVASVWWRPEPFVALVCVAVVLALWELTQAVARVGIDLPLVPLAVGGIAIEVSAHLSGLPGVLVAFFLTVAACLGWRALDPDAAPAFRDAAATVFAAVYIPLLGSFFVLLLSGDQGRWRVLAVIALSVANDTGGYLVGVLLGKHKLAPSISPHKTWEGLAGSVLLAVGVGVAAAALLGGRWWMGVPLGLFAVATSTLGDLSESLLKRELGVKDMGSLLPGHGGVLDRVDSILMTAPVAYAALALV